MTELQNGRFSGRKNDEIKIKTISTKAKTRKEKIWKEENMQE